MPVNELEQHPYLQIGEAIQAKRMIVGTFPIYSLTNPINPRKGQLQHQRGDISFFYGSRANTFWRWYRQFVDGAVNIQNPESIFASLQKNEIAISDVIIQCSRIEESFGDKDLRSKSWNIPLGTLIDLSIDKILCTSKAGSGAMGWLRDQVLIPSGFVLDQVETAHLHQHILSGIPACNAQVVSIAQVFTRGPKKVSVVSLPSPGSPERRLVDFGYVNGVHIITTYLQAYLTQAFNWFLQ